MKNSVRRGLFHPDDIKTLGITPGSPGPMSAPLPGLSRKPSRPSLSPAGVNGPPPGSLRSHSRSSSFVGSGSSSSGSFGRTEAKRVASSHEFDKYAEEDDEDYDDVFGKVNGTSELVFRLVVFEQADSRISPRTTYANPTAQYSALQQVLGTLRCMASASAKFC